LAAAGDSSRIAMAPIADRGAGLRASVALSTADSGSAWTSASTEGGGGGTAAAAAGAGGGMGVQRKSVRFASEGEA
jgi:hypothetical protein